MPQKKQESPPQTVQEPATSSIQPLSSLGQETLDEIVLRTQNPIARMKQANAIIAEVSGGTMRLAGPQVITAMEKLEEELYDPRKITYILHEKTLDDGRRVRGYDPREIAEIETVDLVVLQRQAEREKQMGHADRILAQREQQTGRGRGE